MRNDIVLRQMGLRIRAIRKSKKITLRRLGKLCSLDYGSISRIESGEKDSHILTLMNIAEKLGVDLKDFF
jgi:transcriptional regulator with XRE-family HTH domain